MVDSSVAVEGALHVELAEVEGDGFSVDEAGLLLVCVLDVV